MVSSSRMPPPTCIGTFGMPGDDRLDHRGVDRLAGERAVQVHDVQTALGAGLDPAPGHRDRVVGKDRLFVHASLAQAHLPSFEIDGGNTISSGIN